MKNASTVLLSRLLDIKYHVSLAWIIFLYVQFWIRLTAVSYHAKKVRTVDSLVVRSVNKSRDTRNCVQNEQAYVI